MKSINGKHALVTIPAWKQDLQAILTGDVSVGDAIVVSIRPEKIQIVNPGKSGDNCVEGVVVTSTYIGSDTHLFLDVGGQQVKIWEQNRVSTLDPSAFHGKGKKLRVQLQADNVLVLPRE